MEGNLVFNQFMASTNRYMESPTEEVRRNLTYWTIRYIPYIDKEDIQAREVLIQMAEYELKHFTFRDLVNMFPIDKCYDGDKWGWKDYYFTIKYIEEHGGMDAYIENPFEMVFDYQNDHIREFGVAWLGFMNDNMRDKTGIDMFQGFFNPESYPQDSQGNLIGVDSKGKVHKISNPKDDRPKLRVIK